MRPIATDMARSVVSVCVCAYLSVFVCLCVGHTGELCKNG